VCPDVEASPRVEDPPDPVRASGRGEDRGGGLAGTQDARRGRLPSTDLCASGANVAFYQMVYRPRRPCRLCVILSWARYL